MYNKSYFNFSRDFKSWTNAPLCCISDAGKAGIAHTVLSRQSTIIGTFEEFFDAISERKWKGHQKPIYVVNIDGYYDPLKFAHLHYYFKKHVRPSVR